MKAYEKYKLKWMMDHGYSLEDLMRGLAEMQSESEPGTPVDELFHAWEKDRGFDGSIWACLEEFQDDLKSSQRRSGQLRMWLRSSNKRGMSRPRKTSLSA